MTSAPAALARILIGSTETIARMKFENRPARELRRFVTSLLTMLGAR